MGLLVRWSRTRLTASVRHRLRALVQPVALIGWLPVLWKMLQWMQLADWIAAKIRGSAMLTFLQEYGWLLGLAWLAAMVFLWPDRRAATLQTEVEIQRVTVQLLRSLARVRLLLHEGTDKVHSSMPEITEIGMESALVDFLLAWVKATPQPERAAIERALDRARLDLSGDWLDDVGHDAMGFLRSYFNMRTGR